MFVTKLKALTGTVGVVLLAAVGLTVALAGSGSTKNPPGAPDGRPQVAKTAVVPDRTRLPRKSLEELVVEAKVVVVATATGSDPAPKKAPADPAEKFVHLKVVRILKGKLEDKTITVRTRDGDEVHVGKDWVVLLSQENLDKTHLFSPLFTANAEAEVKEILAKDKITTIKDVTLTDVDEAGGTISVSFGKKDKPTKLVNVPLAEGVRVVASHVLPGSVNNLPFEWKYVENLKGKVVSIRVTVTATGLSVVSICSGND
jgi:hypothetical protein